MKRKNISSLIIVMLMLFSTFAVATNANTVETESVKLEVVKEVFDGESWVNSIEATYGDTVQFKISVIYHDISQNDYYANNIVVTDTLPPCLQYVETVEPDNMNPTIDGNNLIWNFSETVLRDGDSIIVRFNTSVVGFGENVNEVNVAAKEHCSGEDLSGSDSATVIVKTSLDVEKKVWDPDAKAWVEELGWVIKGENVRFQITSTYYGDIPMKCMLVKDCLPACCFEYANNVYIEIDGKEISENDVSYPDITVENGTWVDHILFDWRSANFYLENGESVVIEFDAKVINYCDRTVTNWACACLWGCYLCNPDNYMQDWDSATIQCVPHDLIFEKTVWNDEKQEWTEETSAYVNETVRFRIELVYYGNHNLTGVQVIDYLPEGILVYANEANIEPSYVSEDKKTIWWNLTKAVEDGVPLIIEFNALVIGSTGDCSCCGTNKATYTAVECETQIPYDGEDTAKITSAYHKIGLSITIPKRMFIGKICAVIENTGEVDLNNVYWEINLTVGGLLKKNVKRNCTIDLLEINKKRRVCTGRPFGPSAIKFKFGRVCGHVLAKVGDYQVEKFFSGFILGRLIVIRQVGPIIPC